jgi:hypothetical protein
MLKNESSVFITQQLRGSTDFTMVVDLQRKKVIREGTLDKGKLDIQKDWSSSPDGHYCFTCDNSFDL